MRNPRTEESRPGYHRVTCDDPADVRREELARRKRKGKRKTVQRSRRGNRG
jgi:hypothetical protein